MGIVAVACLGDVAVAAIVVVMVATTLLPQKGEMCAFVRAFVSAFVHAFVY